MSSQLLTRIMSTDSRITQKLEEVTLEWIPGEDNVADLFMKRMQLRKFIKRLALLGVDYRLGCIDGPLSGKRLPCGEVMSLPAERERQVENEKEKKKGKKPSSPTSTLEKSRILRRRSALWFHRCWR